MVYLLSDDLVFPSPLDAEPNGLLAIGGDLSVDRLLLAYSNGIFPWFNPDDEILWWASPFRPIYIPGEIKVSKSLAKTIKKYPFEIKLDTNFEEVIERCANISRKGEAETWISDEIIDSYRTLFNLGFLHTVEVFLEGEMVGGLYGLSLGKAFFGESMFHIMPDASKVALYALSEMLYDWNFHFIDSQVSNAHSYRMGAREVTNVDFDKMVNEAMNHSTKPGPWEYDFSNLQSMKRSDF